jgi:hypothetical protein
MRYVGHGTLCSLLQCLSVTYFSHIKLGLLIVVLLLLWSYLILEGFHKIHVNTCRWLFFFLMSKKISLKKRKEQLS